MIHFPTHPHFSGHRRVRDWMKVTSDKPPPCNLSLWMSRWRTQESEGGRTLPAHNYMLGSASAASLWATRQLRSQQSHKTRRGEFKRPLVLLECVEECQCPREGSRELRDYSFWPPFGRRADLGKFGDVLDPGGNFRDSPRDRAGISAGRSPIPELSRDFQVRKKENLIPTRRLDHR